MDIITICVMTCTYRWNNQRADNRVVAEHLSSCHFVLMISYDPVCDEWSLYSVYSVAMRSASRV
jgi:hypothetical protein